MKKARKPGSGGARKGSGPKRIFTNPVTINFLIEQEDKIAIKKKYGRTLNQMFIAWMKSLLFFLLIIFISCNKQSTQIPKNGTFLFHLSNGCDYNIPPPKHVELDSNLIPITK
jgi:hypothetical protein